MITYPNENDSFRIDTFRSSCSEHTADYYIHVVNDKTGICKFLFSHFDFDCVMLKYEELKKECAAGWHIEVTVAISLSEVHSRNALP